MTELERLRAERNAAIAERDFYKQREADIIGACERVADGGQYRADIVAAINRIRRERDERDDLLRRMVADHDMRARAIGTSGVDPLIEAAREMLK